MTNKLTDKERRWINKYLFNIYRQIGIDKPNNHESIFEFICNDIAETADPNNWNSPAIAFRRFIENK